MFIKSDWNESTFDFQKQKWMWWYETDISVVYGNNIKWYKKRVQIKKWL